MTRPRSDEVKAILETTTLGLLQSWQPIAWQRRFEDYRATLVMKPDGTVIWRVYPFNVAIPPVSDTAATIELAMMAIARAARTLNVPAPTSG